MTINQNNAQDVIISTSVEVVNAMRTIFENRRARFSVASQNAVYDYTMNTKPFIITVPQTGDEIRVQFMADTEVSGVILNNAKTNTTLNFAFNDHYNRNQIRRSYVVCTINKKFDDDAIPANDTVLGKAFQNALVSNAEVINKLVEIGLLSK